MALAAVSKFHPERVSDAYADARIREKIARFDLPRQREGLRSLDADLRARGVPASTRLHLLSAVAHLSRFGRDARLRREVPDL